MDSATLIRSYVSLCVMHLPPHASWTVLVSPPTPQPLSFVYDNATANNAAIVLLYHAIQVISNFVCD
jgi:hypothetical protein